MNKNELVDAVANSTGLKKQEAEKAVDAVFDSITGELKKGSEVRLVGFGTFAVTNRAASTLSGAGLVPAAARGTGMTSPNESGACNSAL